MFLVERLPRSPIRAELMPRQLFGGAGDIVRAGLVSSPPVFRPLPAETQKAVERQMPSQLDLALPEAAVRRAG
jgi:hypothetical protein